MQTINHTGMTAMCRRGRKHSGKEKEEHFMIQYAKRMGAMAYTANVVSNLFGAMTNPDIISFGGGAPAKEALPIDILRQLTDEVIRKDKRGVEALQYGPLSGTKDMKEVIVNELLLPKGVKCTTDNVMVVAGGLEGINLTCQVYIDPGDVILVESPTFVHSVEIFEMFEAKCIGVDMDEDGMKMDDLEACWRTTPTVIFDTAERTCLPSSASTPWATWWWPTASPRSSPPACAWAM